MKKGRFENTDGRKHPFGILGIVFLMLILLALLLNNCKGAPSMTNDPTTTETTVEKNEGSALLNIEKHPGDDRDAFTFIFACGKVFFAIGRL